MRTKLYNTLTIGILLFASCRSEQTERRPALRMDTTDVSDVIVALPEGNGKELVEMSCVPCHSLRYIEMQPDMTKKAWEKIVTKMIKNYGAPVKDSIAASAIVDYLATIKGEKG